MTIAVRLFAILRETAGADHVQVQVEPGSTAEQAFDILCRDHPELARFRPIVTFAVNGEYSSAATVLHDGDELALIPPISGG